MKPQETHREATRIRHLSRAPSARSGDMASQKRSVRWPGFVHHFAYSFLIRKLRWVPLAAPLPHLAIMSASMIPMTLTGTNSDQRSAAGYRGIFAAVASSASHKLYRVALRRTRNAAEAEDVSQEALLKALTHRHQFQGPEGSANSFQSCRPRPFACVFSALAGNCARDCTNRRERPFDGRFPHRGDRSGGRPCSRRYARFPASPAAIDLLALGRRASGVRIAPPVVAKLRPNASNKPMSCMKIPALTLGTAGGNLFS